MTGNSSFTEKTVFTTGEVAHICNISQQTVIRCFDKGSLRGFRVPGSKFRRIPREALLTFMRENSIPRDRIDSGRRKILLVDDDAGIIRMFEDLLGVDKRFELRSARSGFEAGTLTEQFRPDLILLDFKLPDLNGNVVCRLVRSNPAYEHIRIIMVSGAADPDEVEMLRSAGADDFIAKPFKWDVMRRRIEELLELD